MKIETLPLPPTVTGGPDGPDGPDSKQPRKKRLAILVGVVLLLLAAGLGYAMKGRGAAAAVETKVDKDKEAPQVAVYELSKADVAVIERRELRLHLPLSGALAPSDSATVKSKVSGVVLESTLQEGTAVTAGQVIARLDAGDQRARVAQMQAACDEAQARLSLATKNSTNSQALLRQNYISQSSHDSSQNSVELAQASLAAARAQLDMARIALADTVIKAPLAGVISKRHVQAGEKLAPDMPVATIVSLRRLNLEAQVPASEVPRVKIGQEVRFKVDGFQQRDFVGTVARISPTTEAGSRSMVVYVSVDNSDASLRGGMFAKGAITTEKSAPVPLVPLAAVRTVKGEPVVYTIVGGKVAQQAVTLGLRNDDDGIAEVRTGLQDGATVIVARLDTVKPGQQVKIAAAATPTPVPVPAAASKG